MDKYKKAYVIERTYELAEIISKDNELRRTIADLFLRNNLPKDIAKKLMNDSKIQEVFSENIWRNATTFVLKGNGVKGIFSKSFYNMVIPIMIDSIARTRGGKANSKENYQRASEESRKKKGINSWGDCETYIVTQLREEGCSYRFIAESLNLRDGYNLRKNHTPSSVSSWFHRQKK